MRENAWKTYDSETMKKVFELSEGYKKFISDCKTERECVIESIAMAKAKGYRDLEEVIANGETLKAGDKVYANNMGKTILNWETAIRKWNEYFRGACRQSSFGY